MGGKKNSVDKESHHKAVHFLFQEEVQLHDGMHKEE